MTDKAARIREAIERLQAHKRGLLKSGLTPDQVANRAPRPDAGERDNAL